MALDEPKENDAIYEKDGFKYVIDKNTNKHYQPIRVDFSYMGFQITSAADHERGHFSGC